MARLGLCVCLFWFLAAPLGTATPPAAPLDTATPTDLVAEVVSPTEVRLTWTDNAIGEDRYAIHRSLDGGHSWNYSPSPADATSYVDDGVSPCTHYVYRVYAVYPGGQAFPSDMVAVTTPSEAPPGVEILLWESFESDTLPIDWENLGGWAASPGGDPPDGTQKAQVPTLGTGGALRSPPIPCGDAPQITLSFGALSSVKGTELSYYRLLVQGEGGEPVALDPLIQTGGAWTERTYTITDPALLTPATTLWWDARVQFERAYLDAVTVTRPVPIVPPTAITRPPEDVTVCGGSTAAFEVEAVGGDLAYRWQRNPSDSPIAPWSDLPGAEGPRLDLTGLTPADSGHRVRAVVTGACATAYSFPATLTVGSGGTITAQPLPQAACPGGGAAFSVTAEGEGLTYRWQRDGEDLVDDEHVQGATSATLTLSGVTPGDAGAYRCRVGDGICGAVSEEAPLAVWRSLEILEQPEDVAACPGEGVTFAVGAVGDGLAYQWQVGGVDLPGAVGATLALPAVSAEDAGDYRCVLSGPCGTLATTPSSLTVGAPPEVTGHPQDVTVEEGQGATFSVEAEGTDLTYHWETSADGGLVYTPLPDAQGPALSTGPLGIADDGRLYRVRVAGTCGSATSLPAGATVLRVQEIFLEAGWQIVGLSVEPLEGDVGAIFGGLEERVGSVYAWRAGAWRLYAPAAPEGSDLGALGVGEGYWVYAHAPATLRVAGRVPGETPIPLAAGWTLTGFPAGAPRALPGALGGAGIPPDLVYGYTAAGGWGHHDPAAPSWANSLAALEPGRGYWVHAAQETTWTVGY